MHKQRNKKQILIQSVLASTFFVAPLLASAATVVNQAITDDLTTSGATGGDGTIIITSTGQVIGKTTNPVTVDSDLGKVILREGNKYFSVPDGALVPVAAGKSSISIVPAGTNAEVNIAPVVFITNSGQGSTILVEGDNAVINNAGKLTATDDNVIFITSDGVTLFNDITGNIANSDSDTAYATVATDAALNFELKDNLGMIQSNEPIKAAFSIFEGNFKSFTNSGFIQQASDGNPVAVSEPAIYLGTNSLSGNFLNNATGVISLLEPDVGEANADTILIDQFTEMGDFINHGIIENKITDVGISNIFGSALNIAGKLNSLENTGRIYSTDLHKDGSGTLVSTPTILGQSTAVIANGFTNTGAVIHGVQGADAVNFSNMEAMSMTNAGTVNGNIALAPQGLSDGKGGFLPVFTSVKAAPNAIYNSVVTGRIIGDDDANSNVYEIQGGILRSIENDVDAVTTAYEGKANVYNLSGGEITDYLHLPNVPSTITSPFPTVNVVNLSGTHVGAIVGSDTDGAAIGDDIFNVTGGSFASLDGGLDGTSTDGDILNIMKTFTTNAVISHMDFVNVQKAGTIFTANNLISGVQGFTIDQNTTFTSHNIIRAIGNTTGKAITTSVNNNGLMIVPPLADPDSVMSMVFDFSVDDTAFNSVVVNKGVVQLQTTGVLGILGNNIGDNTRTLGIAQANNTVFINASPTDSTPAGVFRPHIFGPWCEPVLYGRMDVDSFDTDEDAVIVDLQEGSFIQPQFVGYLPAGSQMDIINVFTGGNANLSTNPTSINDKSSIIPYPSALVFFTKQNLLLPLEGPPAGDEQETSVIRLTSHRNTFASMSSTGVTPGVAATLDTFTTGCPPTHDFYVLLSEFDQIPTQAGVEAAMESLVPGFNYGLIAGSHIGMDSAFEAITDRVFELSWNGRHHQLRFPARGAVRQAALPGDQNIQLASNGSNFGDGSDPIGVWGRVIGAYLDQSTREGVAGYTAKGAGFAIGADWGLNDCTTYGLALSYTKVNVDDKAFAPKDDAIKSWQGTLYGAYDFCYGIFADAIVGFAHNKYDTNRVIHVHDLLTAANASFNGSQWGLQGDLGISIPNESCYFFAPFVRLKYISVNFDDYNEKGAGDFNLSVSLDKASEFLGGIGFRVARDFQSNGVEWVPELMAMIGYDFHNDGEQTLANFVGAGPAFGTNGITPGKTMFDLGLALNAVCGSSVFTAKYNLELRSEFVGNAGYLQYYYTWS